MQFKTMTVLFLSIQLFSTFCAAAPKKKRTFVVKVEPAASAQPASRGGRRGKVRTLADLGAGQHDALMGLMNRLGAGGAPQWKTVMTDEYYDEFHPFPQNLFLGKTPGFVNLGQHGWRMYSGKQELVRRGSEDGSTQQCYAAGDKVDQSITAGGQLWSPERELRSRAGVTHFKEIMRDGGVLLLAGLLAELLLYRSYKKQPKRIQEAEEKLRQAVEELEGAHPLHFFDWTVEGDQLYKRVVYLLDEYDDGVPKSVETALKQCRNAYEGPSTLRRGVTHGLTLAGLLATLYGGINQKRLADYTKGMPAVGRTGGRTLGRT